MGAFLLTAAYTVCLTLGIGDTARWVRTGDPIAAADAMAEVPFAALLGALLVTT